MKRILLVSALCSVLVIAAGCSMAVNNQKVLDDMKAAQGKIEDLTKENTKLTEKIADLEEQIDNFGDIDISDIEAEMTRLSDENVKLKVMNDSLLQVIDKLKKGTTSGGGSSGGGGLGPNVIID
ncbi:hypothetical protein JW890_01500 [candidate division WOR-3 bacterium]|nr:hypothetical protein [candidate division WOR-3 bacterium]